MHRISLNICCYFLFVAILTCCGCAKKEAGQLKEIEIEEIDEVKEKADIEEKKDTLSTEKQESADSTDSTKEASMFVHICGAVKSPGVYEMPAGSRIYEGIQRAGGMTEEAASDALNQAELLLDGQRIYVPTIDEAERLEANMPPVGNTSDITDRKVNLNTAVKEALMTLSGIGESKADSIIRYREEHGGFGSIEEVMQIEGIKDGVFQKIKDQITV